MSARARKLLVFDTAYTLEAVRLRRQETHILYLDLDGFFEHVWTVHPFATLLTSDDWGPRYGAPDNYELAPRHTVIHGKVGRFAWLKWLFPMNFLLSQADLFLRLRRLVRREKISAIRVPNPLYVGLFGWLLAKVCGVPLVIRVGANLDELRKYTGKPVEPRLTRTRRIEKLLERFLFPRADLVAGANEDNLNFALANGARPERSTIFRYGNLIDPRHFVAPSERVLDRGLPAQLGLAGKPFIMTVARLEDVGAVKHPEDIVWVLKHLADQGVDVKAVIVGDGPLRSRLIECAGQLAVTDRLVIAGSRDQGWLAQMYPQAAVHVCPHAGRALSEAALAGAPTVAYDVDWQRELIETDVTGILVEYRNHAAMAAATARLLCDPKLARRLAENLRRRALAMLDPEKLTKHEQQEYARLLSRFARQGSRS
jgi:glycosyltransferase involved in cell wall biosynthesis